MNGIIRIGDPTTSGGSVLAGSTSMIFDGKGVARLGDPVHCNKKGHGKTVIAQGASTFCDNGVPVAFNGHLCACGCALVTTLPSATAG